MLRRADGTLHELGRGAMGVTYKAFDTNLRSFVALKVINALHLDSETARARFLREARAAAALRHRNIATVYHLGNDDQSFFFAMEFVDGQTLEAMVKTKGVALSTKDALQIALQVSRALGAAAKQGLVHRDIKPANIMVEHEDDTEDDFVVKVIDFGLARSTSGGEGSAHITMGGFVGTPQFASPEQLEEKDLDSRSDIYSLGVTLWYLLAGRPPFVGPLGSVFVQQLTKEPPWEQLASQPERVKALLARLLQKDPARRPQSPSELRREIEACLRSIASTTGRIDLPISPAGATSASNLASQARILTGQTTGENPTTGSRSASSTPEPLRATVPVPAENSVRPGVATTGTLLGGRYELGEFIGQGNNGRVFCARDLARDQHAFAIKLLHPDVLITEGERSRLTQTIAKLHAAPHSHLTWVESLEEVPGCRFLVQEWVSGFTLVDLLRIRGQLPVRETLQLLGQTAAAVDHAFSHELNRLELGLHQILVHFPSMADGSSTGRTLVGKPADQWPSDFSLKLDALGITREAGDSVTWAGDMTMMPSGPTLGRDTQTSIRGLVESSRFFALGMLTYELLNGAPPAQGRGEDGRGIKFAALPALNEECNDILRRMLIPNPGFGSATEFFHALCNASGVVIPLASSTTITPTIALRNVNPAETIPLGNGIGQPSPGQQHEGATLVLHEPSPDTVAAGRLMVEVPPEGESDIIISTRASESARAPVVAPLASETLVRPRKAKYPAQGVLDVDQAPGPATKADPIVSVPAPVLDEVAVVVQPVEAKHDVLRTGEAQETPVSGISPTDTQDIHAKHDTLPPVDHLEAPAVTVSPPDVNAEVILAAKHTEQSPSTANELVEAKRDSPTLFVNPAASPVTTPTPDGEFIAPIAPVAGTAHVDAEPFGADLLAAAELVSSSYGLKAPVRVPETESDIWSEKVTSTDQHRLDREDISFNQSAFSEAPSMRSADVECHNLAEPASAVEDTENERPVLAEKSESIAPAPFADAVPWLPTAGKSSRNTYGERSEPLPSRWRKPRVIAGVAALTFLGTVGALIRSHHSFPKAAPVQHSVQVAQPSLELGAPHEVQPVVSEVVPSPSDPNPPASDAGAALQSNSSIPFPATPESTPVVATVPVSTPPPVRATSSTPAPPSFDAKAQRARDLASGRERDAEQRVLSDKHEAERELAEGHEEQKRDADQKALADRRDPERKDARELAHKDPKPVPTLKLKPAPVVKATPPPKAKQATRPAPTPNPDANPGGPGIGFER